MSKFKYKAFISYSHADEAWGRWLHHAVETFHVPDMLVGHNTVNGPVPKHIKPVFRDREDFEASAHLGEKIQQALADSQFQIVICSPRAAKSKWVNEEIRLFKSLHGPSHTLAIIVDGEPGASAIPGREHEECFPDALRFVVDDDGKVTDTRTEPIAADARKTGDGKRGALLKINAGVLGVRLDDLIQRDATRRAKRQTIFTGIAASVALVTGALAFVAVQARNEADKMRSESDGLIEFMLTDLRSKLETVGRLDVLDDVGAHVLTHYSNQNERALSDEALARRARAMLLVGEVDQSENNLDDALAAYNTAAGSTAELLRRSPDNPDRIWDHAQSVFYVGNIASVRGERANADTQFQEYYRLAEELRRVDPENARSHLEVAYATSNLGSILFQANRYDAAVPFFEEATVAHKALWDGAPQNQQLALDYAYTLSWHAWAELLRGDFNNTVSITQAQLETYDAIDYATEDNFKYLDILVTAQRRRAQAFLYLGDFSAARSATEIGFQAAQKLIARDKDNANYRVNGARLLLIQSYLAAHSNNTQQALTLADQSLSIAREIYNRDPSFIDATSTLAATLAWYVVTHTTTDKGKTAAAELEKMVNKAIKQGDQDVLQLIAEGTLALAQFEIANDNKSQALARIEKNIQHLTPHKDKLSVHTQLALAGLLQIKGDDKSAAQLKNHFKNKEINHPLFLVSRYGADN